MKVWVLSTCVPGDSEPCWPRVFTSETEAYDAFEQSIRSEWQNCRCDDETGEPLPFPDDVNDAHDKLAENPDWGQWEVTCHDITPEPVTVMVTVEAGMVQNVTVPEGITVIVRDHDVQDAEDEAERFTEETWEHEAAEEVLS
jgi:hypothetical protein